MKKQGALFFKLLRISLTVLLLLFLLLSFWEGGEDYSLREIMICEVGDGIPVSGFVVREERLLLAGETAPELTVREGQWLSSGQCYGIFRCCEADTHPVIPLCTAKSGYFSQSIDGFEGVLTYEAMQTMGVGDFQLLQCPEPPSGAMGKLVSGQTWYFAALLPEGTGYEVGEGLTLEFDMLGQLPMNLCHLSPVAEGKQLAVFSCRREMGQILNCRRLSGEILGQRLRGLEVPKAALYHIDGETGVYVLLGQRAKWKEITILRDLGENVLAEYRVGEPNALQEEDVLIITTQEIENGKVIQ
ncbi:MAG: hypothetical protein IJ453_00865 [Oscillospiraceae bacterium]|nr:hypothetical protein [Oscillospiraceae bacterium]